MRRPLSLAAAAAGAVLAACLAPPSAQAQSNDHLIIPGQRVGAVRLGMSEAELDRAMGDPQSTDPGFHGEYFYEYKSLIAGVDRGLVVYIVALDPSYALAGGVHVGSSRLAVRATLGPPPVTCKQKAVEDQWEWSYPADEIAVLIASAGVKGITTYSPGTWTPCP